MTPQLAFFKTGGRALFLTLVSVMFSACGGEPEEPTSTAFPTETARAATATAETTDPTLTVQTLSPTASPVGAAETTVPSPAPQPSTPTVQTLSPTATPAQSIAGQSLTPQPSPTVSPPVSIPSPTPVSRPETRATPTPTTAPAPSPTPTETASPAATSAPSAHQTQNTALSLVATYVNVSVYVSFQGDENADNHATLEYRESRSGAFIEGMDMVPDRRAMIQNDQSGIPNPFKDQWRASILGLKPGTEYEIRVMIDDPDGVSGSNAVAATVSTWIETNQILSSGRTLQVAANGNDDSGDGSAARPWATIQKAADVVKPGDTVVVMPGTYAESVRVTRSGAVNNYITFVAAEPASPENPSVVIAPPGDPESRETTGFSTDASYVRIRGFAIVGGNTGVRIGDASHHVIVEDNFISDYGDGGAGVELGGRMFGEAYSPSTSVRNVTVQRNEIHVTTVQTTDRGGIESLDNLGGHVIRHNTVRFLHEGAGNHGEDCIMHIENSEFDDGYKDTDIHGNFCYDATDDGIELDGNNVNTRVWDNVIVGANVGFSIGPSGVGPTYVYRNVVHNLSQAWTRCNGIKEGRSSSGHVFFYHNTFYLPADACEGDGFILADSAGRPSWNIVLKNNVFWFAERGISISRPIENDVVADYNLYFDEIVKGGVKTYQRGGAKLYH